MSMDDLYSKTYKKMNNKGLNKIDISKGPINRTEFGVIYSETGERVLDVGCGDGELLFNLSDKYSELHGIDVSSFRVENAKNNLKGQNAQIVQCEFDNGTHYENEYFDTVVTLDVIEHILDVRAAFREFYRILKSGGALVISTPNVARINYRLRLLLGRFPGTAFSNEGLDTREGEDMIDAGHIHYFTFRALRFLAEEAGFTQELKIGIGSRPFIYNLWPELLSGSVSLVLRKNNG